MRLDIQIDTKREETEVVIFTPKMTDRINRIVDFIDRLDDNAAVISGIKNDKIELLQQEELVRIFAESGKVYVKTQKDCYQVRMRLYELEQRLDTTMFVRISNSEIVNLKMVKSLDLSFAGTICMELINGDVSYVSRRHVSSMKKKLGL